MVECKYEWYKYVKVTAAKSTGYTVLNKWVGTQQWVTEMHGSRDCR